MKQAVSLLRKDAALIQQSLFTFIKNWNRFLLPGLWSMTWSADKTGGHGQGLRVPAGLGGRGRRAGSGSGRNGDVARGSRPGRRGWAEEGREEMDGEAGIISVRGGGSRPGGPASPGSACAAHPGARRELPLERGKLLLEHPGLRGEVLRERREAPLPAGASGGAAGTTAAGDPGAPRGAAWRAPR